MRTQSHGSKVLENELRFPYDGGRVTLMVCAPALPIGKRFSFTAYTFREKRGIDKVDEITELKKDVHTLTVELISGCKYCTMISTNYEFKTPIYCSRFTGPIHPTCLDVKTCLSCGEYKNH